MSQVKRNADSETGQRLVYSSPAIHERRRRILEETRKMIAEQGLAGFSMDEIGKRAGVAKRTLYNAFQTKERMIAIAIHEYFERYVARLPYTGPIGSLQRNVERMLFVIQRNRQLKNYIAAIMSIYFSPDAATDIWDTMHSMAVEANLQWIDVVKAKNELQPWADSKRLADDLVRCAYSIINDWCRGKIADDDIAYHLVTASLMIGAGATRGETRKEIEGMLARFEADGVAAPALTRRLPRR